MVRSPLEPGGLLLRHPALSRFLIIVIYDEAVNVRDASLVLWKFFNNVDPKRDMAAREKPHRHWTPLERERRTAIIGPGPMTSSWTRRLWSASKEGAKNWVSRRFC